MPAGIENPIFGGIAFAAIKLGGYCLVAQMLNKRYDKQHSNWFGVGAARTLIGFAFGYPYFNWATSAFNFPVFMAGLVPIRIVEWLLLVILFYDRRLQDRRRACVSALQGTFWSFMFDLPATVGWIAVAGFWVC